MILQQHTPSNFELTIELIQVLVWPVTLLIILFLFRRYFKEAMQRLGSINAGASGISLNFSKKIEEAKQIAKALTPISGVPSAAINPTDTSTKTPRQQLTEIRKNIDTTLQNLATANKLPLNDKDTLAMTNELKDVGIIPIDKARLVEALVALTETPNANVTQDQVNEIRALYLANI